MCVLERRCFFVAIVIFFVFLRFPTPKFLYFVSFQFKMESTTDREEGSTNADGVKKHEADVRDDPEVVEPEKTEESATVATQSSEVSVGLWTMRRLFCCVFPCVTKGSHDVNKQNTLADFTGSSDAKDPTWSQAYPASP
ncbi:hypothetical protein L596_028034 [Steinernema carpocapsae]|uniref:Uncharacterized protein n=1 Tax=Steinernema carpocapsae TaxID=34508 RepID=A0A4U5LX88_STECR|nr:hypothetical protein L596_028034 [Steinernema carpocapsae]